MQKIWNDNGLPFYTANDIAIRNHIIAVLSLEVQDVLLNENKSWTFKQIEAPCIIPSGMISSEYDTEDYYQLATDPGTYISLRPETTAASYAYGKYLNEHLRFTPPMCIWQNAKSFRAENDQVSKNMRFKEFYQLEFQCLYTEGTKNDYHNAVLEPMRAAVERLVGSSAVRIVESDRLPSYSLKTMDIEVDTGHKWLEVCSISLRNDVPFDWNGKKLMNVEIAFGTDRLTAILGRGL